MAVALVTIHQVNAAPIVQARAAVAFINLVTTDGSHVPRVADAGVGVDPILALAMVARIWVTVVDVLITQYASETCGTLAFIAIRVIDALGPIQAGSTGAVINVDLAHWSCEASDLIQAGGVVLAGV